MIEHRTDCLLPEPGLEQGRSGGFARRSFFGLAVVPELLRELALKVPLQFALGLQKSHVLAAGTVRLLGD